MDETRDDEQAQPASPQGDGDPGPQTDAVQEPPSDEPKPAETLADA